jgi:hypothetical protein
MQTKMVVFSQLTRIGQKEKRLMKAFNSALVFFILVGAPLTYAAPSAIPGRFIFETRIAVL